MRHMAMRRFVGACAALTLGIGPLAGTAFSAATEEQKQQIAEVEQALKELPALLKAKKIEDVAERLAAAQTLLSELSEGEAKDDPALAILEKKVAAAEKLFKSKSAAGDKPAKPKPAPRAKPKKPAPAKPKAGEISFIKQVFPIFNGKCANCHIRM